MSKTIPTVGDTVIYWPSQEDINECQARRDSGESVNVPIMGQPMSAVVVAAWSPGCLNLKVQVDGNTPDLWRTSINQRAIYGVTEPSWEFEWQAEYAGRM